MQGYYMLEVLAEKGVPAIRLELSSQPSSSFSSTWVLPIQGEGCFKRICYFSAPVNSFSTNLEDSREGAKKYNVSFTRLSERFAFNLLDKKLINKLGKKVCLESKSNHEKYKLYDHIFSRANQVVDYQAWIASSEPFTWREPIKFEACNDILFSIIVPTYNAKSVWLNECFQSVLDQTYDNWQLIIVDDASTDSDSLDCLNYWKKNLDKRIKIIRRESNGHICAATNDGINLASGSYICFLDHDDALVPHALNELAISIDLNPGVKVLYSDEDLISESGRRMRPHFKPDWNPELLLNHNYITHLCCYDSGLIKELGGLREGLDGAQDYDLILRASRLIAAENIHHIPKVLYHWRMVEGSTAMSSGAKSYATKAGFRALTDHIAAINPDAEVKYGNSENFYKVHWPLSSSIAEELPKVSIVIPTRDGLEVLKPCIDGLLNKTSYPNFDITVLDNGSHKLETLSYLDDLSQNEMIRVIRDEGPFNYSRINNDAVRHTNGDLVCLLNNDIEVIHSDWLDQMVAQAIRPNVGCVGAKLLYPDGTIQHAGVILGLGGYAAHAFRGLDRDFPGRAQISQNVSAVTAACLVVKRSIFDAVGGLDENFQVAYNDVDFCLRVGKAGFVNIYTPDAELYHHESKTRGSDAAPQNQKRFEKEKALLLEKWSEVIANDPAYNPNLTRSREDFSVGTINAE